MAEAVLLCGCIYAFYSFVLAYAIFAEFWKSGIVALIVFILTAIAVVYDIMALLAVFTIGLPLLTIILVFAKKKG